MNRDTVGLAYEALTKEGLIESTVGRGTFVRRRERAGPVAPFEPVLSPLVDRLLDLERSRVRYATPAGTVPLHALVPDPTLYPVEEFRRTLNRVLSESGSELLRYGVPQGDPGQVARYRLVAHSPEVVAMTALIGADPPASSPYPSLSRGTR